MLGFFPNAYPDEIMYSIIARYHIRSGNSKVEQTQMDLFGMGNQISHEINLHHHLSRIVSRLPLGSRETVENYIHNHTNFTFYALFLTPHEISKLRALMEKGGNQSIAQVAKIPQSFINNCQILKFCPLCLEEELEKYGEGYWHKIHQIPGVLICPNHREILYLSSEDIKDRYQLPKIQKDIQQIKLLHKTDKTFFELVRFAETIQELKLNPPHTFKGLSWLRKQYQGLLIQKGFIKVFSRQKFEFQENKFTDAMIQFYGKDFLEVVHPDLMSKPESYFSSCLLACDLNQTIDRVVHLLIINFLLGSIRSFFK